jgi:hypothetical protein
MEFNAAHRALSISVPCFTACVKHFGEAAVFLRHEPHADVSTAFCRWDLLNYRLGVMTRAGRQAGATEAGGAVKMAHRGVGEGLF